MRNALLICGLASVLACGTEPKGSLAGFYTLTQINGHPPPGFDGIDTIELSGSLDLRPDGSFVWFEDDSVVSAHVRVTVSMPGAWTVDGSTLTLTDTEGVHPIIWTGAIAGRTLLFQLPMYQPPTLILLFERK